MKRKSIIEKILFTFLLTIVLVMPTKVFAVTYGEILDDLSKAETDLRNNQNSINNTQGKINTDSASIRKLQEEIKAMQDEAVKLQQEIADSNAEIDNKKQQTKSVIAYLQMSQGENVYLDYVFGSDSITDVVYRMSVVEQITEYNDQVVKELEALIKANEERKIELAAREKESETKIQNLNSEIAKLNKTKASLLSESPSLEDEVKAKKIIAQSYKEQGCKNRSDVIGRDCATTASNAIFQRPIRKGYVTSFTGYRHICTPRNGCYYNFHKGIDLGSPDGRNTPIYSIGKGQVKKKWSDTAGALNVTIYYNLNGTYYSATYAHLDRYANIYEGMNVDANTIIGYMGATGNVTGIHLHLEVYPCRLWGDNQCGNWNSYSSFAENMFKNGYKGSESVISFPSGTYRYWYSR